jgi:hypothetical protein
LLVYPLLEKGDTCCGEGAALPAALVPALLLPLLPSLPGLPHAGTAGAGGAALGSTSGCMIQYFKPCAHACAPLGQPRNCVRTKAWARAG